MLSLAALIDSIGRLVVTRRSTAMVLIVAVPMMLERLPEPTAEPDSWLRLAALCDIQCSQPWGVAGGTPNGHLRIVPASRPPEELGSSSPR
jgi:hypothetical protein